METPLIAPEALAPLLGPGGPALLDCRVTRVAQAEGASLWLSGREDWAAERLPGAAYVHMVDDLSDVDAPVPYTPPAPAELARRLAALGVDLAADRIVVYGAGGAGDMAAHRAWWVLSHAGATVQALDGGLAAWRAAGLPLERGAPPAPAPVPVPAALPAPRPGMLADKAAVAAALGDPATVLLNDLTPELFRGEGGQVFGRRGRIAGSRSLPADAVIDPATGRFAAPETIRARLAEAAPEGAERIVTYCGGGIAASTLLLALVQAGVADAALYDGSLLEWGADPAAPMEIG